MTERVVQRRLAAIVSADVVAYTRLMERDEVGTHARLRARFKALVEPKIGEHGGRIVKLMGDGLLAEFPSVVNAVNWAVEVQAKVAELSATEPDEQRIVYRVGVNLGDVIVDGDDIYGDGVNVAARLQEIAERGGVCISEKVQTEVRGKINVEFVDGGTQTVKNVRDPLRIWRWSPGQVEASDATLRPLAGEPLALPDKPSIAVLPFDNMSGDPEQEFFADGLAEDIITILSKISKLMVIARNSSFAYKGTATDVRQIASDLGVRYVLEGSVRKSGNRLRATAQLIDATIGSHIWAERYDRLVEDVFDIQDNITKEIVTALRVQLTDGEEALVWNKGTQDIDAWRWALEAGELFFQFTPAEIARARDILHRSIKCDPNYAYAWAMIGACDWYLARIGSSDDAEASIERAEQSVAKSLELDDRLSWGHFSQGMVLLYRKHFDEAVSALQEAVALHPGNANVRASLGMVLIHAGRPEEGLQAMREAMRLNPLAHIWYRFIAARAQDMLGDLEQALVEFRSTTHDIAFASHIHIASLLVRLGRTQEAKVALSEAVRHNSQFGLGAVDRYLMCQDGEYVKSVTESLREAGLPE